MNEMVRLSIPLPDVISEQSLQLAARNFGLDMTGNSAAAASASTHGP